MTKKLNNFNQQGKRAWMQLLMSNNKPSNKPKNYIMPKKAFVF